MKKKVIKTPPKRPKEWLTTEIAQAYKDTFDGFVDFTGFTGETRQLMDDLKDRCGVTELEACNIIRGYHIDEYVNKYGLLKEEYEKYYEEAKKWA